MESPRYMIMYGGSSCVIESCESLPDSCIMKERVGWTICWWPCPANLGGNKKWKTLSVYARIFCRNAGK